MGIARMLCVIALIPATAFAEKSYNTETSATHDCNKEPVVAINSNNGTFTLTGACEKVGVNGNTTTVKIERVKKLGVNGNGNVVEAATVTNIGVNGADNTVWWRVGATKSKKPGVGIAGKNNKVQQKKP